MKIYIKENGKRIVIPLPLSLVKLGINFMNSPLILKHIPEKDRKYIDIIDFHNLSKCVGILKEYKGLNLVEVKSADGTEVHITV